MVRSLLENTAESCCLYILESNFTDKDKRDLLASWKLNNLSSVQFVHVETDRLNCFRVHRKLRHREACIVFYLGDLLPDSIDRCVFLDQDLIVTDDIAEIYNVDLRGNVVGVVKDISTKQTKLNTERRQRFGIRRPEEFFNGGLLVIDLRKWREEKIDARLQRYAIENYYRLIGVNQDVLNAVLEDRKLLLEERWNSSQYDRDVGLNHRGIVHLIGPVKPWHPGYAYKFKNTFLNILERTAIDVQELKLESRFQGTLLKLKLIVPTWRILLDKVVKLVTRNGRIENI